MKRFAAVLALLAVLTLSASAPADAYGRHHHHHHGHDRLVLCWGTTWTPESVCAAWWAEWNRANA